MDKRIRRMYTRKEGDKNNRWANLEVAYHCLVDLCTVRASEVYETRRAYWKKNCLKKDLGKERWGEIGREKGKVIWARRRLGRLAYWRGKGPVWMSGGGNIAGT